MDRAEFLNRLEALLLDLPQAEREEALQYYEDYLDDAGDAGESDILQKLGTPEEVAESIRRGLRQDASAAGEPDENWQASASVGERSYGSQSSRSGQAGENWQDGTSAGEPGDGWQSGSGAEQLGAGGRKRFPIWLWILLIVFVAPVVLPIAFGLLVAAISVLFALFVTGIALLVCGIVCAGAGVWALIQALTQIAVWPAAAMIGIGISLAAIGIGVLMTLLMGWLIGKVVPAGVRALCNCLHRILTRKGGRAA